MLVRLGAVGVLTACGRLGFDATGGTTADAGATGDAAALPPCGNVTDNFDSGATAPMWMTYTDPGSTFAQTGGQLVVDPAPSMARSYAGYDSRIAYAVHECVTTIQSVRIVSTSGCSCYLSLDTADAMHTLAFDVSVGGSGARIDSTDLGGTPSVTAGWWQVLEHAGTTTWRVSPDGVAWTVIATMPTPVWASALMFNIGGGTQSSVVAPGQCVFDNFGLPP